MNASVILSLVKSILRTLFVCLVNIIFYRNPSITILKVQLLEHYSYMKILFCRNRDIFLYQVCPYQFLICLVVASFISTTSIYKHSNPVSTPLCI